VKFLSSIPIEEAQETGVWRTQDPLTNWDLVSESDVGSGRDLKETFSSQRRSVVTTVGFQDCHFADLMKLFKGQKDSNGVASAVKLHVKYVLFIFQFSKKNQQMH
jgi:hypothetical protein